MQVWTKTTTAYGIHYRHSNGLTLREGAGRMWTVQNDSGQGHHVPSLTPMRCLATGLDWACLREERGMEGLPAHLSVAQFVEAIADLHTGGLP